MIIPDSGHILFIEPTRPASSEPVEDELSAKIRAEMRNAKPSDYAFRGFHCCACGKRGDNKDYFLSSGQKTNILALHYMEYHRDEVPESELEKVRALLAS